ncbi:hypothetical protein NQ317_014077 [Molorchus minor]|uniref:Uncharacterized protein n=1 Tax=Molorchus minor TaxID=1323400 RepID=A0ABQ9JFA3_9CUCU|nr:hypothetical protein NQ317_014077 [Molorchus minor]
MAPNRCYEHLAMLLFVLSLKSSRNKKLANRRQHRQIRPHRKTGLALKDTRNSFISSKGVRMLPGAKCRTLGVSSTSSLAMTDDEIKRNNYKRKIEEQSPDLDMTYTMSVNITPNKPKVKMCAEQLLSKVLKPPPPKRIASGMGPRSPRNKENKTVRRPSGAVDGSRAFAGKSKSILKALDNSRMKKLLPKTVSFHEQSFGDN